MLCIDLKRASHALSRHRALQSRQSVTGTQTQGHGAWTNGDKIAGLKTCIMYMQCWSIDDTVQRTTLTKALDRWQQQLARQLVHADGKLTACSFAQAGQHHYSETQTRDVPLSRRDMKTTAAVLMCRQQSCDNSTARRQWCASMLPAEQMLPGAAHEQQCIIKFEYPTLSGPTLALRSLGLQVRSSDRYELHQLR